MAYDFCFKCFGFEEDFTMKALFEILYALYALIIQVPFLLVTVLIIIIQYLSITISFVTLIIRFLPTPFAVAGFVLVFINIVLKIINR